MELQELPLEEKEEEPLAVVQAGVDVSGLTFGYTQDNVLENVSLHIAPGEFVAVIGESGIGKTTLIRIIMSFMSNIQGSVTFYNEKGETQEGECRNAEFHCICASG